MLAMGTQQLETRLLTIPEAAAVLRISVHRCYLLAQKGILPCVHVGRCVRVDKNQLSFFIEQGGAIRSRGNSHTGDAISRRHSTNGAIVRREEIE
jgi:excisionase family DNA binding protein